MKNIFRISAIILLILSVFIIHSCKKDKPTPPFITTTAVAKISYTTATSGGDVTNEGGAPVTASGVCWNTSADPTIANSKTIESIGSGIFTSNLTQLIPNTMYYVRAYATNLAGTGYGNQVIFTTSPIATATLTTTAITSITQTGAVSGGNITSENGGSVTARGVCWSTTTNPTTALSTKTTDGTGTGIFTSSITGLTAGTVYYVKAYATNSVGTAYGTQVSFSTTASTVPVLTTTAASAITQTTATSGGNITSDGGATVTARGVCWSTTTGPTTALSTKTTDGIGTGIFTSSITGLTAGTVYYVKAYATNSVGTAYGTQVSFSTTASTVPVLTTTAASAITQTTATSGGNITSDGGATVTARGICWNTSVNPTIALSTKTSETGTTGAFTSSIAGLTALTTYYVRAYATNSAGTSYGTQLSFTTTASTVPVLTTTAVSSITLTTATSGGNITSNGGATVIARGVCWSTSQNPTIANSKTSDNTGTGIFTSSITGLTAGTVYYVKAYATNSVGTAYGTQVSFSTTASTIPVLTTIAAFSITLTTATSGGNITSNGGATVIARGVCWSTNQNPTIANSKTSDNTGTGYYNSSITGLTAGTVYYVKAYATNSVGTAYGTQVSFITDPLTVSDVEGNIYNVVRIGTQIWMKVNLKTTKYRNGDLIGTTTPATLDISDESTPKYQWAYDGNESNVATYGRLYTWYTVTDSRNVCPTGWHVPTDAEWTTLTDYLGGVSDAGGKLKEAGTTHWFTPNTGATNETGFTALPGGNRLNSHGPFNDFGNFGYWWSSTDFSTTIAWFRFMSFNQKYIIRSNYLSDGNLKQSGFSVRCLKD